MAHDTCVAIASGAVPVGITVGTPRFPLAYKPVWYRLLAPVGHLFAIDDQADFTAAFRARLDGIGFDRIREQLELIAAGRELVLLCFENVTDGQDWCHRRVAAAWLQEHGLEYAGELPELPSTRPDRPPRPAPAPMQLHLPEPGPMDAKTLLAAIRALLAG